LFESLAVVYFAALAVALSIGYARGRRGWMAAAAAAAVTASAVTLAAVTLPVTARLWVAHLYLVTAYWLPALAEPREDDGAFERWLVNADVRWPQRLVRVPRWLALAGELAYLLCYPFVPAAFAVVWLAGTIDDADRFWTAVLLAGFSCYGSLPWLTARPPRLLSARGREPGRVAGVNAAILARLSHGRTTFPSGHVAVSIAAALSVLSVSIPGALVFTAIAAGIALGAATGRYHYVIDVVTGIAAGLLALLVAALV
jgi:hypothetical protein